MRREKDETQLKQEVHKSQNRNSKLNPEVGSCLHFVLTLTRTFDMYLRLHAAGFGNLEPTAMEIEQKD